MILKASNFFSKIMQRWLPDAFLFAVILSLVVFICGILFQGQSPIQMAEHWGNGLWSLLSFSMQMVLILVLGQTLATSAPIRKGLSHVASLAGTPTQAVVLVTLVSIIAALINWGFGLVIGALVAREVANKVKSVHFPLLIAAAYSGFLVWHGGLSGSIPLKIASTNNDPLNDLLKGQAIAVGETIFAFENLLIVALLLIALPIINSLMHPKTHITPLAKTNKDESLNEKTTPPSTPAERLEKSPLLSILVVLLCSIYLAHYFYQGHGLNLNIINLCLLTLALAFHGNPDKFLIAFKASVASASGVILQFPLYAGLMGMMVKSGLAAAISLWFVEIATPQSFSLLTFLSAGLVNFFVPSGGGQWAVQAPIVIPAAQSLGVPLNHAAMAVAWGDAWTNMIQPFWALPLLSIAGLSIRDIMGYCCVIFIVSGVLIGGLIYWLY